MADTGFINSGELTPNYAGGGNGGNDRIIDGNLSTITQIYSFSGETKTHYMHSFSGTDIPSGATINGVELVVSGRYDPTYTEFKCYFGIAKDGDGTDGNADDATFSDVADGSSGYTGTVGIDNGGGDITNDGGIGIWDIPSSLGGTTTFGSPTTTWCIDWGTGGLDLTNLVVKMVVAYDISSGIYIHDFAELDLKIYYTEEVAYQNRLKLKSGTISLKSGGKITLK
jgi:hypothetical protein